MPIGNTTDRYGSVSKTLHWLIALLIAVLIPLGLIASDMAQTLIASPDADKSADLARIVWLFSMHKTLGVTAFFAALLRLIWSIWQPKPAAFTVSWSQTLLADIVRWLLLGTLVLVPLTGWVHHAATTGFAPIWWPFGQSLPMIAKSADVAATSAGLHRLLINILILAFLVHLAGVLKHSLIDRDATLRRMLPGSSPMPAAVPTRHSPIAPVSAVVILIVALGFGLSTYANRDQPQTARLATTTSQWAVQSGTLGLEITVLGAQVQGRFDDWTADLTFTNPQSNGPAGQVTVTINIASLTLGSITDQAMGPDYFDVERFPIATFTAHIQKTADGYTATGPLTVRGKTKAISLPFDLRLQDNSADMTASLTLNRLDFDIATPLPDQTTLAFDVLVSVALTARRQP